MDNSHDSKYGKNGLVDEGFNPKCTYKTYKQLINFK